MKRLLFFTIFFSFISVLCILGDAGASAWEDIFKNLSDGRRINPGERMGSPLYNASLNFIITNNDGIANNFSGSDTIALHISGNGESLSFNGTNTELVAWSKKHSDKLLRIIFGSSPETAFGGSTSSSYNIQQFFITPSPSLESSAENGFVPVTTKDIAVTGQYDFMKIGKDNTSATGESGLLNYEQKFGVDAANSIGIAIPYRNIKLDDSLDSKYMFASFLPYYKHRWYMDKSVVEWLINLTLNVNYLESSLFPDGSGYYEYGGGTGVKYGYRLHPNVDINAGLVFELLKKQIPSDLVPEEIRWISNAVNDLSVEEDLVPSLGVIWRILPKKLTFRGELFRIMQLQSGVASGMRNQTVALGIFNFKPSKSIDLAVGYKRSFEIDNLTDQSLIASFRYAW
jgi:hypothetical protein